MKIEFVKGRKNPYRQRQTGNLVFVYSVEGTPVEIAAYKAANPKSVEDTVSKKMLFFTTKYSKQTAELKVSDKGNYYPEVDELDVLAEATALYGIEVASMICKGTGSRLTVAE